MEWLLLGLAAAFLSSIKNLLTKKVSFAADQYTVAWASNVFVLPLLWIAALVSGIPAIDHRFWIIIAVMLPFEIVVNLLFFKAIKDSELSLSIPFISFLPLFIAVGAFLILGEQLNTQLILAVLLLSLGAYIMGVEKLDRSGVMAPFRNLLMRSGPPLILLVAIIWGFLIPLAKLAIQHSSAQLFPAVYFTLSAILFTPIFLKKNQHGFETIRKQWKNFALIGLVYGFFTISVWRAYASGPATLVNAVTELDLIFTVVLAGAFLSEKGIVKRFIATAIMLAGALVIIFS